MSDLLKRGPWDDDEDLAKPSKSPWDNDEILGEETNVARQFAGGFNEGLAFLGGLPDAGERMMEPLARGSLNLIPGVNIPEMTDEQFKASKPFGTPIRDTLRGLVPEGPTTGMQRGARRAGEVVAENLPFAALGGVTAMAKTAAQAAPALKAETSRLIAGLTKGGMPVKTAAKLLPNLPLSEAIKLGGRAMQQGLANAPGTAQVGELIAATGAGVGSQVAREQFPGNPYAEAALMTAGGIAAPVASVAPSALVARGAKAGLDRFRPTVSKQRSRDALGTALGETMGDDTLSAIARGEELRGDIEGFNPSLAETTNNPALIATQKQFEQNASGAHLNQSKARIAGNREAIDRFAEQQAPQGVVDPDFIVDTASGRVRALKEGLESGRAKNIEDAVALGGSIPKVQPDAVGKGLRDSMLDRQVEARARIAKLSDDLGIDDADITVSIRKAQDEVRDEFRDRSVFGDKGNRPKVLDDFINYGSRSDDATRSLLAAVRSGNIPPPPGVTPSTRGPAIPKPKSLMQYLRSKGGVQDQGGELSGMDLNRANLIKKNGLTLDDAALFATEDGYFPGTDRASIRELLDALDNEARGQNTYSYFDAENVAMLDDMARFRADLDQNGISLDLPDAEVMRRLDFTTKGNGPTVTFKDLMGLRSRISDDLRDAISGANPSAKKIATLKQLEAKTDKVINELTLDADPALAANYKQFREAYKTEYIDRFNQGAAFEVRARDGRGFYQVADERVAQAFWKDIESAKQFKRTFGEGSPETQSLSAVVMDDLARAAVRDGTVSESLLNTWVRKNAGQLDEFPEIKQLVSDVQTATKSINKRNAQLDKRGKAIEDQILNRQLTAHGKGNIEADAVIKQAIKQPRKMNQLINRLKRTPEALDALKRTIWDDVTKLEPKAMADALEANKRSLGMVFEPGHLKSLRTIAEAGEIAARAPAVQGKPIDTNALADVESALGTPINSIASRFFAAESGRTSWRYVTTEMLGRLLRGQSQKETARLMNDVIYNPQIAKDMASILRTKRVPPYMAKRINAWLLTVGGQDDE